VPTSTDPPRSSIPGDESGRGGGPDDVGVVHLLEEGDLADGGGGDALVLLLEADLLERDRLVGDPVQRLVHHPVRAFPDLLLLLVLHTQTREIRAGESRLGIRIEPDHTPLPAPLRPMRLAAARGGGGGEGGVGIQG
jgi:hypothetical protein